MTKQEAAALKKRINEEGVKGLRVKEGTTNGQTVLHIVVPGSNLGTRTISRVSEWDSEACDHINATARKKKRDEKNRAAEGIAEAIANKEAQ